MRRILTLFVIPLVLAGQSNWLAHAHHGVSTIEPEAHSSRPHFHLHDGHTDHHHDHDVDVDHHDDEDQPMHPGWQALADHDASAVYFSVSWSSTDSVRKYSSNWMKQLAAGPASWVSDTLTLASLIRCDSRGEPPQFAHSNCPIYLLTLSLRI